MNFWKTKQWAPMDIACLKWSSALLGIVLGTLLADTLKPYIVLLLIAAVLLAIKPTLNYLRD